MPFASSREVDQRLVAETALTEQEVRDLIPWMRQISEGGMRRLNAELALQNIGAVGGVCGLGSLWYSRRQTVLMEGQIRRNEAQNKEELDWAERFEHLANQLSRINPRLQIQEPGKNSPIVLYDSILPDPKFQDALENYIVRVNISRTQFSQRNPRPDELRRTNLRDTITKAEQCMTEFQRENPGINLTYYMG